MSDVDDMWRELRLLRKRIEKLEASAELNEPIAPPQQAAQQAGTGERRCIHDHVVEAPGGWFDCQDCGAHNVTPNEGASVMPCWHVTALAGIADQCRKGHWLNVLCRLNEFELRALQELGAALKKARP